MSFINYFRNPQAACRPVVDHAVVRDACINYCPNALKIRVQYGTW